MSFWSAVKGAVRMVVKVVATTYLMWPGSDRGDDTHWWQRNLFRASRHVTYW